jgi:hypothetical protein
VGAATAEPAHPTAAAVNVVAAATVKLILFIGVLLGEVVTKSLAETPKV